MKQKKQFQKRFTDRKIKLKGRALVILILIMFITVIHDSFKHDLPFYYILYLIGGIFIGRYIAFTQKVLIDEDTEMLTLKIKPIGLVITVLLLLFRYFAGQYILEQFNVVWAADAIYLLFIGIYFAKIKSLIKQIDEHVYTYVFEKSVRY